MDISLSVVTEWSGPQGFVTAQMAQAMTGSTTIYTSTYVVSSFGRNESGNYTCATNITSTSLFLIDSEEQVNTSRITIGKQCKDCLFSLRFYITTVTILSVIWTSNPLADFLLLSVI